MNTALFSNVYLIDKYRDGKLIQHEETHNIIPYAGLKNFLEGSAYSSSAFNGFPPAVTCVLLSSSTPPSYAEELPDLTSSISAIVDSWVPGVFASDYSSVTFTNKYTFPANSSYVGTFRSICISATRALTPTSLRSNLCTHALIVDSENNPIEIEKTALDELIVTAKFTLIRPSWTTGLTWLFRYSPLRGIDGLKESLITFTSSQSHGKGPLTLYTSWYFDMPGINWMPSYITLVAPTYSDNTLAVSCEFTPEQNAYDGATVEATFANFINSMGVGTHAISVGGAPTVVGNYGSPCIVLLPNADVFPITQLEALELGTGDGSTTDFTPVIPAWLRNTEKVYKNGVQLTRGSDYLVDNVANLDSKLCCMLSTFVCDVSADDERIFGQLFGANAMAADSDAGANIHGGYCPVVKPSKPIILEYSLQHAFSAKANKCVLGNWVASESAPAGTRIAFYYSTDNKSTWTLFGTIARTTAGTAFKDISVHDVPLVDGITNVKIQLENFGSFSGYLYLKYTAGEQRSFLGYVGAYAIRFLTPPAVGDVLTMDASIDRPWKDSNVSITWSPILEFGL